MRKTYERKLPSVSEERRRSERLWSGADSSDASDTFVNFVDTDDPDSADVRDTFGKFGDADTSDGCEDPKRSAHGGSIAPQNAKKRGKRVRGELGSDDEEAGAEDESENGSENGSENETGRRTKKSGKSRSSSVIGRGSAIGSVVGSSAKEYAMLLVSGGTYTEKGLERKMRSKERFSDDEIAEAMEYVKSFGYISDARLAANSIGKLAARLWGKKKICFYLASKGMSEEVIEGLDFSEIDFPAYCATLIARCGDKPKEKVMRTLLNAGYTSEDIREAWSRVDE